MAQVGSIGSSVRSRFRQEVQLLKGYLCTLDAGVYFFRVRVDYSFLLKYASLVFAVMAISIQRMLASTPNRTPASNAADAPTTFFAR